MVTPYEQGVIAPYLRLVPEVSMKLKNGKTFIPDGTLKDQLRLDHGYWEIKNEIDDINEEDQKEIRQGLSQRQYTVRRSQTAVLFQHGVEIMRLRMQEYGQLDKQSTTMWVLIR